MGIAQEQINQSPQYALHGTLAYKMRDSKVGSYLNQKGAIAGVKRLLVAFVASYAYTWSVNGVALTYTEDGDGTAAAVAAKIRTVTNNNSIVGRKAQAGGSAANVDISARFAGDDPTVVGGTNLTLSTVTNASSPSKIGFGLGVIWDGQDTDGTKRAKLFDPSEYTAREVELVYGSGTVYATVTVDGTTIRASGTSAALLATDLDAKLSDDLVTVAEAGGTITLTAATAGIQFSVIPEGAITQTVTAAGDDINSLMRGVTLWTNRSAEYDAYLEGHPMDVLEDGEAFIVFDAAPSISSKLYLGTTADERGKLYGSLATGRVPIGYRVVSVHTDNIGVVQVRPLN